MSNSSSPRRDVSPRGMRTEVSVEDIINIAVNALQVKERQVNVSEVSTLIPEYSGAEDVTAWFTTVDTVKLTYKVSDEMIKLVTIGKLSGQAKKWFHSSPLHAGMTYVMIKEEMTKMFKCEEDKISLMRRFEARRWKRSEKFSEYYFDKVLIGKQLQLSESDLIHYVIEGFDDVQLQVQAKIKEFSSLSHLLEVMNTITVLERRGGYSASAIPKKTFQTSGQSKPSTSGATRRCYNCYSENHLAIECPKPKRERGSCFECHRTDHQVKDCPKRRDVQKRSRSITAPADSTVTPVCTEVGPDLVPAYTVSCSFGMDSDNCYEAVVDSGSPISLVSEEIVLNCPIQPYEGSQTFVGLNKSKLNILGIFEDTLVLENCKCKILFHVVPSDTFNFDVLLGRNFISNDCLEISFGEKLEIQPKTQNFEVNEICFIQYINENDCPELDINESLSAGQKKEVYDIFKKFYLYAEKPEKPATDYELKINLKPDSKPFFTKPRRLSFYEQREVDQHVKELLANNIIKKSESNFASRVVLVEKKDKKTRLCVDFRDLNKNVLRDNFPQPIIEQQIERLRDKNYFSKLDLKNAFFNVRVRKSDTKYLSFVTPTNQYEFLRAPFGFCNSPAAFNRFLNLIFNDLMEKNVIILFMDDLLVTTLSFSEHISVLQDIFQRLTKNILELRLDKCSFLKNKIDFLGYSVDINGITPCTDHIKSVQSYPLPKNKKELHSFVGLISYFRKYISNFSIEAKPLYDLLRNNVDFRMGLEQLQAFEKFKNILSSKPVLSLYSPEAETQLHCDSSSLGFGAILMQKQSDFKFHPVMYFSKRTSEIESRYHSYELECLGVIYAIKRFHVYLQGIQFKIVTDCDSFRLALSKRDISPRIMRWAIFLESYNYTIEHRRNPQMRHVDALSRCHNILILEENSFEQLLSIKQYSDPSIVEMRKRLEKEESSFFELRNGLVYRKDKRSGNLLFYVPKDLQQNIIRMYHDNMAHVGLDKTCNLILKSYWFPKLRDKVKEYISNCLKCIHFSPNYGKVEGELFSIPKGRVAFETIHVDHYGPLEKCSNGDRYILAVIDAFTKFCKLYPCHTVNTREVIKHLKSYFSNYSIPKRLISDRGAAFGSHDFESFLQEFDVKHILVATGAPWANGQVERLNRTIGPMIAKSCDGPEKWNKILSQVEFAINNTVCKSTGESPSRLLFGVEQRGLIDDSVMSILEQINPVSHYDLVETREKAYENIIKSQHYSKQRYDKLHKSPRKYSIGDKVVITNTVTTPGVNKKLLPRFKGPYEVEKVLPHNRYVLKDIEGFQVTQIPYHGTVEVSHMRPWHKENGSDWSEIDSEDDSDGESETIKIVVE